MLCIVLYCIALLLLLYVYMYVGFQIRNLDSFSNLITNFINDKTVYYLRVN